MCKEVKSDRIAVRLTPTEKERITEYSKQQHLSASDFIRFIVLTYIDQHTPDRKE